MTFDPFGDFATRGYLRNIAKAKDPEIVQRLLHNSFLTGIRKGSEMKDIAGAIKAAPGLDGSEADTVAGETTDPTVEARYEAQELTRKGGKGSAQKS